MDFQALDEEELVLKEEVTTAQQGLTAVQQDGFLLPQLSAFLEQPLNGKGTGGEIGRAGILLVELC